MKTVLALDLDGTCLNDVGASTPRLCEQLQELPDGVILIYATGKSFDSALPAFKEGCLPTPQYLVTDVGNRIFQFQSDRYQADSLYESFVSGCWQQLQLGTRTIGLEPDAIPQEGARFCRLAYWAGSPETAMRAAARLRDHPRVSSNGLVRWDGPTRDGRYWIDVIHWATGKGSAVAYIALLEGVPNNHVLAMGDSMNDLDLLDGRYHAVASANATRRLRETLEVLDRPLDVMGSAGPLGVVSAIDQYLVKALSGEPTLGSPGENKRLLELRGKCRANGLADCLNPWPERLRNWGLKPGSVPSCYLAPMKEFPLSFVERGRNWWWEFAGAERRKQICEYYDALPVPFLIDKLRHYAEEKCGARLLGGTVTGPFLYGRPSEQVGDLDMVLILDGLDKASLGFEIEVPGLRNALKGNHDRLAQDHIGLGLIDIRSLNGHTEEPDVLQMVASVEGSGIPLFGQIVSDSPMPNYDLVCQALKLLYDGSSYLEAWPPGAARKIRIRCDETAHVLALASRENTYNRAFCRLHSGDLSSRESCGALLEARRQEVTKVFLGLVDRLLTGAGNECKRTS